MLEIVTSGPKMQRHFILRCQVTPLRCVIFHADDTRTELIKTIFATRLSLRYRERYLPLSFDHEASLRAVPEKNPLKGARIFRPLHPQDKKKTTRPHPGQINRPGPPSLGQK